MSKKFFKTTYTIVVLSEGTPAAGLDLSALEYSMEDDCIGSRSDDGGVEVPADQIEAELLAVGNDGLFFDLGD